MRRSRLIMLLGVTALFAAWGTARVVDSWRYRASLKQAKARLDSGSPSEARRLLAESAARWPGEGEVSSCSVPASKPSVAPTPPKQPGRACRPIRPLPGTRPCSASGCY